MSMSVNLRKAAKLASSLLAVKSLASPSISFSRFDAIPTPLLIDQEREKLLATVYEETETIEAAFAIRHLIGQANQAEISTLLNGLACVSACLVYLKKGTIKAEKPSNLPAFVKRMEEAAVRPPENNYLPERDLVFVFDVREETEDSVLRLERTKREIEEKLQALNFTTTIEIPDDIVEILKKNNLV